MGRLVLSRKVDEGIHIGDDVFIVVLGIMNGKVRLGIEAPNDVEVDREEVRERKQRAKGSATDGGSH